MVCILSVAARGQLDNSPWSKSNATKLLVTEDEAESKLGEAKNEESWEMIPSSFQREWSVRLK